MRLGIKSSLLISIVIHLLIVSLYIWYITPKIKKKSIVKNKISLDISKFQTLPPKTSTIPKPSLTKESKATPVTPPPIPPKPITPPKPNKPVVKKVTPTPLPPTPKAITTKKANKKVAETKKIEKQVSKVNKKIKIEKPKKIVKKEISKKPKKVVRHSKVIKHTKPHKKRYTRIRPKGPNSHLINSLYGSSYSRMSKSQRKYIDRYLRQIIQISQRTLNYLGYPPEAIALRQQGVNLVEFWLHPNGDISRLRLKRRLHSEYLNKQTIEVIKTAYMYYPHPPVKTKIIIYVGYKLY